MVNHPNRTATSIIFNGSIRVLMVDTDLKMDRLDPRYDAEKALSLHDACKAFVDKFPLLVDTYAIRAWN